VSTDPAAPVRYLYFMDELDPAAATTVLELATSEDTGWTGTSITILSDAFANVPTDASGGIVVMNGPVGTGALISNIGLVTFDQADVPTIMINKINTADPVPGEFGMPVDLSNETTITITGTGFGPMGSPTMETMRVSFHPEGAPNAFPIYSNSDPSWSETSLTFNRPAIYGHGMIRIEGNDENTNFVYSNRVPVNFGMPALTITELNGNAITAGGQPVLLPEMLSGINLVGTGFGGMNSMADRVVAYVTGEAGDTMNPLNAIILVDNSNMTGKVWTDTNISKTGLALGIPADTFGVIGVYPVPEGMTSMDADFMNPIGQLVPAGTTTDPGPGGDEVISVEISDIAPMNITLGTSQTPVTVTATGLDDDFPMGMVYIEHDPADMEAEPIIKLPLAVNTLYTGTLFAGISSNGWGSTSVVGNFPPEDQLPTGMTGMGHIVFVDLTDDANIKSVSVPYTTMVTLSGTTPPPTGNTNIGALQLGFAPPVTLATLTPDPELMPMHPFGVYGSGFGPQATTMADKALVIIQRSGTNPDVIENHKVVMTNLEGMWQDGSVVVSLVDLTGLQPGLAEVGIFGSTDGMNWDFANPVAPQLIGVTIPDEGTPPTGGTTPGTDNSITTLNGMPATTPDIIVPIGVEFMLDGTGFGDSGTNPATAALVFKPTGGTAVEIMTNEKGYDWSVTNIMYFFGDTGAGQPQFDPTPGTGELYMAVPGTPDVATSNVVTIEFVNLPAINSLGGQTVTSLDQYAPLPDMTTLPQTSTMSDLAIGGTDFGPAVVSPSEEDKMLVFTEYDTMGNPQTPVPLFGNSSPNWSETGLTIPQADLPMMGTGGLLTIVPVEGSTPDFSKPMTRIPVVWGM